MVIMKIQLSKVYPNPFNQIRKVYLTTWETIPYSIIPVNILKNLKIAPVPLLGPGEAN